MTTKTFTIDFYTGQIGADRSAGPVSPILKELAKKDRCPVVVIGNMNYEVRNLEMSNHGASFKGVFAKFRKDNIPHAGSPGGEERDLELEEDEGLLEKNHFLYFRKHELLVYQRNGHGCTTNRMGRYLSHIVDETTVFNPVLQPEPMKRLLRGDVELRNLDLKFARPTNPQLFKRNQWLSSVMNVIGHSGAANLSLKISGKSRSANPEERYLFEDVKRHISELMGLTEVKRARFEVEEDGCKHPIDLIADRLMSKQDVIMDGHYPPPDEMYTALRRARDENRNILREYFGEPESALA